MKVIDIGNSRCRVLPLLAYSLLKFSTDFITLTLYRNEKYDTNQVKGKRTLGAISLGKNLNRSGKNPADFSILRVRVCLGVNENSKSFLSMVFGDIFNTNIDFTLSLGLR